MATEATAIALRYFAEVFDDGNLAAVDELFSAEAVDRDLVKEVHQALRTALPDLRCTVDDTVSEGDRVAVRWTARGMHLGAFHGAPPTGRLVEFSGIHILQVQEGRIVQHWTAQDYLGLLTRLDVLTPT